MKLKAVQPRAKDRQERKPKYIELLMEKAKQREREHEVIYERKIAKERSKGDHLYADKDKFVTAAYKRKLQEQAKWLEEERLREERDDVIKKTDISDFYFNLTKTFAFGGDEGKSKKAEKHHERQQLSMEIKRQDHEVSVCPPSTESTELADNPRLDELFEEKAVKPATDNVIESSVSDQPNIDHHKRSQDAVAAAKERFLARKRAKNQ